MPNTNNISITEISLFDTFEIRKVWYNEERYFPINDIVFVLTETKNIKTYIRDMKNRDNELSKGWGKISSPLWVETRWWRQKLNCTNTKWALRILQSIPSPKAEPFKQWLALLWNERIDEINNPELGIQRAKARAIEIRKKQWHDNKKNSKYRYKKYFYGFTQRKGYKRWFWICSVDQQSLQCLTMSTWMSIRI